MSIAANGRSARVIAVTSGKGGVGKTNVSVNLAVALARLGKQAMLVDGDVGLANANILLGLNAQATIADVLARERAADRGPGISQSGAGRGCRSVSLPIALARWSRERKTARD